MASQFVRNANQNYLKLKCINEKNNASYQIEMIAHNRIKHLLKCKKQVIDNNIFLFYEITSMQNLESLSSKKEIDKLWLKDFLDSLKRVLKETKEYFLDVADILFVPQFLFWDMDNKEIRFVYYPYYGKGLAEDLKELMEYLVQKIDYEQEELVEIVYELYERIEEAAGNIKVEQIISILEKIEEKEKKEEKEEKQHTTKEEFEEKFEVTIENEKTQVQTGISIKNLLTIMIFILGISGGSLYLFLTYTLDKEEILLFVGGITAVIAGIILYLIFLFRKGQTRKLHDEEPIYLQETKVEEKEENVEYGKTMIFEKSGPENKLFGIGKHNHQIIELRKYPFIIGKSEEYADAIICDASVSRIHARFTKEGETLFLEDLNSTNATYKNGRSLEPHEIVEINPEDEVRFGNMHFVYR